MGFRVSGFGLRLRRLGTPCQTEQLYPPGDLYGGRHGDLHGGRRQLPAETHSARGRMSDRMINRMRDRMINRMRKNTPENVRPDARLPLGDFSHAVSRAPRWFFSRGARPRLPKGQGGCGWRGVSVGPPAPHLLQLTSRRPHSTATRDPKYNKKNQTQRPQPQGGKSAFPGDDPSLAGGLAALSGWCPGERPSGRRP